MAITMKDVAQRAGVSVATVSRVLHGHPNVREETRARVWQAIEELGYSPNRAAQALAARRRKVLSPPAESSSQEGGEPPAEQPEVS